MFNINNKVKQFFCGNWSSNKYTKKKTEIPDDFGYEKVKTPKKKKKSKGSKPYVSPYHTCPFCERELADRGVFGVRFRCLREKKQVCDVCNARRVDECPACKAKTWMKDGVYKHQYHGCGFEGRKRGES